MHINKSKRGDGLETETSFTTVNFPRMRSFFITGTLLPLDGCGRFGGDVVDYAVDPLDLVDDVVRHVGQELVGQVHPVGRHAVRGGHGAQGHAALVGALVAHHADALHRKQDSPRLPHLIVQPGGAQRVDIYFVDVLEDFDLLGRDVAQNADRKARSREGMAAIIPVTASL